MMSSRSRSEDVAGHPTLIHQAPSFTPSLKSALQERQQLRSRKQKDRSHISSSAESMATSKLAVNEDQTQNEKMKKAGDDLIRIKSMVTCGICDQLLHEPFVLACGHTYCYTCLCSWFVENKRKKTCPECRTRVRQTPAQNYTVKSIVDVILHAPSAIPPEELQEQITRRAEENAELEKDKASDEGLFKGTFTEHPLLRRPVFDEADGVLRCHACGTEHLGGPSCVVCQVQFAPREYDTDFSDIDDDESILGHDLDDIEVDLDANEIAAEAHFRAHHQFLGMPHFGAHHQVHYPHHRHGGIDDIADDDGDSGSSEEPDDEEDTGSLVNFIVDDEDEPPRAAGRRTRNQPAVVIDSDDDEEDGPPVRRSRNRPEEIIDLTSDDDDDSDEGGAISNGRSRRAVASAAPRLRAVPDALSISDDESEHDESQSEINFRMQQAGWNQLDHDRHEFDVFDYESQSEDNFNDRYGDGNGSGSEEEENSSTTTETLGRRNPGRCGVEDEIDATDEEEDDQSELRYSPTPIPRQRHSETPQYNRRGSATPSQTPFSMHSGYDAEDSVSAGFSPPQYDGGDADSDHFYNYAPFNTGISVAISREHDEDTEMSVTSSRESSVSVGNNANAYNEGFGARIDRDTSESQESEYMSMDPHANTYVANDLHEAEEESSDSDVRLPPRRQPRAEVHNHRNPFLPNPQPSTTPGRRGNPISLEGAGEGWQDEVRTVMGSSNSSRSRNMNAYRNMPARRVDPLRSSRSPSNNRVITSSSRNNRFPRQYSRRG